MSFDRISLGTFLKEAQEVLKEIPDPNPADQTFQYILLNRNEGPDDLIRIARTSHEQARWAKNLVLVDSLTLPEDLDCDEDVKELVDKLFTRLKFSKLAILQDFKETTNRRKKGLSIQDHELLDAKYVNEERKNVADGPFDVLLSISVNPTGKLACGASDFEVLGSCRLQDFFRQISCENRLQSQLSLLSNADNICPGTLADFEKLMNEGDVPNNPFWSVARIDDVLYGHQVSDHLNRVPATLIPMDELRWRDMVVRLNQPYAFGHGSMCLHYFIVTQIRLIKASPGTEAVRIKSRSREKRRICRICDQFNAMLVTVDDRFAPENPCYFCRDCFTALHYDPQGRLLYSDFKLFPYLGDH